MSYELKDFKNNVLENKKPVLVDFYADWCRPCRMLGPVLEDAVSKAEGEWDLIKINVDQHPDLAAQYRISGIPSVKLFYNGKIAAEFSGLKTRGDLHAWLDEALPLTKS